jgi:hypothetical protein
LLFPPQFGAELLGPRPDQFARQARAAFVVTLTIGDHPYEAIAAGREGGHASRHLE